MIKRTVGDGAIGIQNHPDTIKIRIDAQTVIHLKIEVIVMTAVVIVVAVADDVIMNTIVEKIDGTHIEAVTRVQNIVTIKNPTEIICHPWIVRIQRTTAAAQQQYIRHHRIITVAIIIHRLIVVAVARRFISIHLYRE